MTKVITARIEERDKGHISRDFVDDIHYGIGEIIGDLFGDCFEEQNVTFSNRGDRNFLTYALTNNRAIILKYRYRELNWLALHIILSDGAEKLWTPKNPFYVRVNDYLGRRNMVIR